MPLPVSTVRRLRSFTPLAAGHVVAAGWLALGLTALTVACKIHEARQIDPQIGGLSLAILTAADVTTGLTGLALVLAVLHLCREPWRRRVLVMACIGSVLLGIAAIADDGFFTASGTRMDGNILRYGLLHVFDLHGVVASAIPDYVYPACSGVSLAVLLPVGLRYLRPVRDRSLWTRRPWRWRHPLAIAVAVAWLGLFGIATALAEAPLPPALMTLRSGVYAQLAAGLVANPPPPTHLTPFRPPVVQPGPDAKRLNVVLIVLESTRARSVTAYQPGLQTMPFLAQMAAQGTRVRQAFTTLPHTTKSIVPIHCGMWPKFDIANVEALPDGMPTDCLPALLRRQGWATALLQSVDERFEAGEKFPRNFGFSHFAGPEHMKTEGFDRCSYFGFEDDVLVQPALDWVDQQKSPFFLTLLTVTPHHRYTVPKGFATVEFHTGNADHDKYLNDLRYMDRFLAKVVDGFRQRNLMDRTVFVVLGDHGESFGEHGRWGHDNTIYEEGVQIPLVLFGAGVPRGHVVEGLRQNIDVMPTILDLLGMAIEPGDLPGRSLLSTPGHDRLVFSCKDRHQCMALRRGDRKYIWHFGKRPTEVFDVARDPDELHDLASTVPTAEVATAEAEIQAWKAKVDGWYVAHSDHLVQRFVTAAAQADSVAQVGELGADLTLRGFDVQPKRAAPGDLVEVTVDLAVLRTPDDVAPEVTITGPGGVRWDTDHAPVAGKLAVPDWPAGRVVRDRFLVQVPWDAQPGSYVAAVVRGDHTAGLATVVIGPVEAGR